MTIDKARNRRMLEKYKQADARDAFIMTLLVTRKDWRIHAGLRFNAYAVMDKAQVSRHASLQCMQRFLQRD